MLDAPNTSSRILIMLRRTDIVMIIRSCKTRDINECANLLIDVYSEVPYNEKWELNNAISYLKRFLKIDPENCFVAIMNDKVAGALFAFSYPWHSDNLISIQELFVTVSHRNCGIASKLLAQLNDGMKVGAWVVAHEKSKASLFYSKKGFSEEGPYRFQYGMINT